MKKIYILKMENSKQKLPNIAKIKNELQAFQREVKGYIQVVPMENNIVMVVNEEGAINGMPLNFIYNRQKIYGPVVFCSLTEDMEEFAELTHEQILYIHDLFEKTA